MKIAIIPARVGSKRIPKKNIRLFEGKPLIAYSIRAALDAGVFDRVIVSTDSDEIAEIAKKFGAEAPFRRPAEHATDTATTAAVMNHALEWCESNSIQVDLFCCIYATAPFLTAQDLQQGLKVMLDAKADAACSVTPFEYPIYRALKLEANGRLAMIWPEHEKTRSNDFPEIYHDAGQFYWLDTQVFKGTKSMWPANLVPVILPRTRVQDIDTEEDWQLAEMKFRSTGLYDQKPFESSDS